jgi:hypothetical protein
MSDANGEGGRPRPQFGEYATPEQQRAHIREPLPEPPTPPHPAPQQPVAQPPVPRMSPPAGEPTVGRPPHQVDRLVTIMLLGFGLVNVVLQLPHYFDMGSYAGEFMKLLGIPGTFTVTPAAQAWGVAAAIVYGLGYLATAMLSLRRMRRGKLAWWVPLAGAIVTSLLAGICVWIPLMADPAVASYFQQMAG